MTFRNTRLAQSVHASEFDQSHYYERTKRNHYWLGGTPGQDRLRDLRVGVAGLGGMGSNLAEIMVRLGVGHLKIADPDTIDASNINRQVIANSHTVGVKKAVASANELRNISRDFELVVYENGITAENAEEFVSDLDVIIDEIDVFPFSAHQWLHRAANKKNLPLYSGFIIGLGTHIYKFQGTKFTFDDFMKNDQKEIDQPSVEFIMNRFMNPPPSYVSSTDRWNQFAGEIENRRVPIFGASTFASQSLLAIRIIADVLELTKSLGGVPTPVMPEFLKFDPLDLEMKVCNINDY